MDLRYLQTFKTIVEEGSFSKAAKKMNYTQSTITFHVSQLESELSATLFEKSGRRMVLTKAGEAFIPYVNEVFQALDKMKNYQTDLTECKGDLKIGAPESILCFILPGILKEFHKQAPRVKLYLRSMRSSNIIQALKDDTLDVGFYYGDMDAESQETLERKPFDTYRLILAGSPQVEEILSGESGEDKDALLSAVIQPVQGALKRKFWAYMDNENIHIGNQIVVRSTHTIINLAKNNVGICYLPEFAIRDELDKGELVELSEAHDDEYVSAGYAWRKGKWMSLAMKLFLEVLKSYSEGKNGPMR